MRVDKDLYQSRSSLTATAHEEKVLVQARATVARHALDELDLEMLLDCLGLIPPQAVPSG